MTIFNDNFLRNILDTFLLSQIDGIQFKRQILNDWIETLKSGKLEKQNETAINADFLNDIFGNILGYTYRNPSFWNLEKELKTNIDGQKPDGAIGYFYNDIEKMNTVKGIIELKDAKTDLDKAQNRKNDKRSPVEQAFNYAPKFSKTCKWVIVSNFKEIRLYQANDRTKYECFYLKNLSDEVELKRFLFLLDKERLISKDGTSRIERLIEKNDNYNENKTTDTNIHIVDEIYFLLRKFDGLTYINPNVIANALPFNKSKKYVWHYSNFTLQSIEYKVFKLFKELSISLGIINISDKLQDELKTIGCVEYEKKIQFIIERLNDCMVGYIQSYEDLQKVKAYISKRNIIGASLRNELRDYEEQLKTFNIIYKEQDKNCDCLNCCYNKLKIDKLIKQLKTLEGTEKENMLETAYYHQILGTDGYKKSYLIYQKIAEKQKHKNEIIYFLAKQNTRLLHNFLEGHYELEDKNELLENIRSIDLDALIHELDIIDSNRRKVLIAIKEDEARIKIEREIDKLLNSQQKTKASFENSSHNGFYDYKREIIQHLAAFSHHYSSNYILGDQFTTNQKVYEKIVQACLFSYTIDKRFEVSLMALEKYMLNIIIFNVYPSEIEKLFKEIKTEKLKITQEAKENLLVQVKNFLHSNHGERYWSKPSENKFLKQALTNFRFNQTYRHIFTNLFWILSKVSLGKEELRTFIPVLIDFLKVDDTMYHATLKPLISFMIKNSWAFESKELFQLLKLTNENRNLDDDKFVKSICLGLNEFHQDFKISDNILIQKIIIKSQERPSQKKQLISYWIVSNDECKEILEQYMFKTMNKDFYSPLYKELIYNEVIDLNYSNYFEKYILETNRTKGNGQYKRHSGKPELETFSYINFVLFLYIMNVDLQDKRLKLLQNLCDWQEWLIDPEQFDYSKFKPEWVLLFHPLNTPAFEKFSKIEPIRDSVKQHLKSQYQPQLAEIYVKHLI